MNTSKSLNCGINLDCLHYAAWLFCVLRIYFERTFFITQHVNDLRSVLLIKYIVLMYMSSLYTVFFYQKPISLMHVNNGCVVLRKQSNSNFRLKICPISLTSHLYMCTKPFAYNDGWKVTWCKRLLQMV